MKDFHIPPARRCVRAVNDASTHGRGDRPEDGNGRRRRGRTSSTRLAGAGEVRRVRRHQRRAGRAEEHRLAGAHHHLAPSSVWRHANERRCSTASVSGQTGGPQYSAAAATARNRRRRLDHPDEEQQRLLDVGAIDLGTTMNTATSTIDIDASPSGRRRAVADMAKATKPRATGAEAHTAQPAAFPSRGGAAAAAAPTA